MTVKKIAIIVLMFGGIFSVKSQSFDALKNLVNRRIPWLADKVVFSAIAKENDQDAFELSSNQGHIYIGATDVNSASSGLNWYLKYYCYRNISHMGDNISPVEKLPVLDKKIKIVSPYRYRYALNYCTVSYTMSFYSWKDWERELDWMALNGVNLMLAPVGVEAVWQNTMTKLGFSQKEISDFIPGPAFSAWWLMGNLEGWGGPMSQTTIDQQALLQKKIVKRMKEFGIEPVMQGFYGMVPTTLKNKVNVKVINQGKWAGDFIRPDFLLPTDPYFDKIATVYYDELKKLYGSDFHFFGGDPFHEGGNSTGIDLKFCGQVIQKQMQQSFPASSWVLQGWQANPPSKLLEGLDKSKTLIIELFGENKANWEDRKAYEGTPFIWSNVSNFGDKVSLYGKMQRFSDEVYRAKSGTYSSYLSGIGIIPEGLHNNSAPIDFMLELGWHTEKVNTKEWIKNYVKYRYGKSNDSILAAWQGFLETIYSSPDIYQEGGAESVFCARPSTNIESVSSWGTRKRNYNLEKFAEAVRTFVSVSKEFEQSETYQIDKIDLVRQVNADKGEGKYQEMIEAITKKDLKGFEIASQQFQKMIQQQDQLLNGNPHFSLHTWLKQAIDFGQTKSDKALALRNAKEQITIWGPYDQKTNLHDYAFKEWGGILGSLYLNRWKQFEKHQLEILSNQKSNSPDYFEMEKNWAAQKELFVPNPLSPTTENDVIAQILRSNK